jgi:MFS transporter, MHS family, shikimate and dehydroshikimate transport protein
MTPTIPNDTAAGSESSLPGMRVLVASTIGSTLEWYDYFIYGTAAALVFPHLFFPGASSTAATLASFATFAVGFIVRPLGGAVFGYLGDHIGRRKTLLATLLLMGSATFAIGLLPSYSSAGLIAPILLVVLRIMQGLALGGEWSGSVLIATENAGSKRQGLAGAWPQVGSPAGLLLATGVFTAVSSIDGGAALRDWAWRIPFLITIVLAGVGIWIRLAVEESAAFEQVESSGKEVRNPVVEAVRRHPRNFVLAIFGRIGIDTTFYILTVYALSYVVHQRGVSSGPVLHGLVIGAAIGLFTMPLFGYLTDRIGARVVLCAGLGFMLLFAWPFFLLIDSDRPMLSGLAEAAAYGLGTAAGWAPLGAFMTSLFSPEVRYSGTGVAFQAAGILGGGIAPTVATLIYASTHTSGALAMYWGASCLISLLAIAATRTLPATTSIDRTGETTASDAY